MYQESSLEGISHPKIKLSSTYLHVLPNLDFFSSQHDRIYFYNLSDNAKSFCMKLAWISSFRALPGKQFVSRANK